MGIDTIFFIAILVMSVVIHEVSHGYAANLLGDPTARLEGRLTLNPLKHLDPFGSIILPLLMFLVPGGIIFGWAKPVPVNPLNFKNLRRGELMVSAAGILANFALAIAAAVIYHFLDALPQTFPAILGSLLRFTVTINLVLGVFNLFPIPPLDGSKVLLSQLPLNLAKQYQRLEPYGILILLIFMMIPFGNSSLLQTFLGFFVRLFSSFLGF